MSHGGAILDLNCDLGEHEPPELTAALVAEVSSINVACGGHAGTPERIQQCLNLACQYGVRFGAHPGAPSDFGRGPTALPPVEWVEIVRKQIRVLLDVARPWGIALHHVKLHGSLYHLSDSSAVHADAYLHLIRTEFPGVRVYARSGGGVMRASTQPKFAGVEVWPEVFADRGYLPNGRLVPRGEPGALIDDPSEIQHRVNAFRLGGAIQATDGTALQMAGRTVCFHADTPGVLDLVRVAKLEVA
jgi:UPF0271 protein